MALARGTPVIINDTDCPQNNLVAVIMRCTPDGVWRARYLSTYPCMLYCWTGRDVPTPLSDFGVKLEWNDAGEYRTVPTGEPCVAKYRDGAPRNWQQRGREWWPCRPAAKKLLNEAA